MSWKKEIQYFIKRTLKGFKSFSELNTEFNQRL